MSISFEPRGRYWWARGTLRSPDGGTLKVYESTGLETRDFRRKADVEAAWETRRAQLVKGLVFGAGSVVTFRQCAQSYLDLEPRSARTRKFVERLTDYFGDRLLTSVLTREAADEAVRDIVGNSAAPATKRRVVFVPLTAIGNHGRDKKWCDAPDFGKLPKVGKPPTPFLEPRQAVALIEAAAPHLKPLLVFMLGTGARVSEALDLDWADVHLGEGFVMLRGSKAEKLSDQAAPRKAHLPAAVVAGMVALPHRDGRVFRRDDGAPYEDKGRQEGGQIKTAFRAACRRAGLLYAEGDPLFTPHHCRHSWASWFYAITKDPMLLMGEGGWHSLAMVQRYAHLMRSDLAADVSLVWGASHPRIGALPVRSVEMKEARSA